MCGPGGPNQWCWSFRDQNAAPPSRGWRHKLAAIAGSVLHKRASLLLSRSVPLAFQETNTSIPTEHGIVIIGGNQSRQLKRAVNERNARK